MSYVKTYVPMYGVKKKRMKKEKKKKRKKAQTIDNVAQ